MIDDLRLAGRSGERLATGDADGHDASGTIDIVVPTVGRPSLARLLTALAAEPTPPPAPRPCVIVVDDRPRHRNGTLPPPLDIPIGMVLVHSGGRGPAAARNTGWRAGRGDWVVFLDDDVEPAPGWLAALRRDLAALAGDDGPRRHVSQGRLEVPLPTHRRPTDTERNVANLAGAPWITADLAVSRWLLSLTGGFDERFPRAYREDTELALRLQRAGVTCVRGSRLVHHPVRPAPWWDSVRRQAGNAEDARLRALHGTRWREDAGVAPGHLRRHAATTAALAAICLAAAARRRRSAASAAAGWAASTGWFTWARVRPGPRSVREVAAMAITSALIPPAAVAWRLRGHLDGRRRASRPAAAVLFDRDGTLVHDVPYNGDPDRVALRPGAREALAEVRRAGLRVGLITNQSGIGRGEIDEADVRGVHERLQQLLGRFDTIEHCPHLPADRCPCRKPAPAMVRRAARHLGVDPEDCWVIGDIAADIQAAHQAGARAVLVPTDVTRPDEVRLAPLVAADLRAAVALVLEGSR